jgi:phosphoglycerate dehydrogenase-like enzyme
MAFLFNSDAARGAVFREIFARDLPDLEFFQPSDEIEQERGRYLISWTVPDEISRYRNLEVLFSIGAGVDQFKADIVPGQVKLGMLNAEFFASLPAGARLLHVGRGPQLDQAALIEALDSGRLAAAMLDVTDPEPLPRDHPLWSHPKVMITPHIASVTQPYTAARSVVENIRRHRAGEELIGVVDRTLGY